MPASQVRTTCSMWGMISARKGTQRSPRLWKMNLQQHNIYNFSQNSSYLIFSSIIRPPDCAASSTKFLASRVLTVSTASVKSAILVDTARTFGGGGC